MSSMRVMPGKPVMARRHRVWVIAAMVVRFVLMGVAVVMAVIALNGGDLRWMVLLVPMVIIAVIAQVLSIHHGRFAARVTASGVMIRGSGLHPTTIPWQQIQRIVVPEDPAVGTCPRLLLWNDSSVEVAALGMRRGKNGQPIPDQDYRDAGAELITAHKEWLARQPR